MSKSTTSKFLEARDFLLKHRLDYDRAYREFRWPELEEFNWARDWFDVYARENKQTALWLARDGERDLKLDFAELSERSARVASFLQSRGLKTGERILVSLPNVPAIWELMLAAMKIGAVLIPTSTLATQEDISDRLRRGKANFVVTDISGTERMPVLDSSLKKLVVGEAVKDWEPYENAYSHKLEYVAPSTRVTDPMLLYFTSGTTSKPKLVLHSHQSYPIGHLSTMYWIGIKEGDIHQNISSPGWAKHAWSSFFAPWNAGATIFVHDYARFNASKTVKLLEQNRVNTLCAPPTVWRMMILENLGAKRGRRRSSSRAQSGPGENQRAKSIRGSKARRGSERGNRKSDSAFCKRQTGSVQTPAQNRIRRPAKDHLRQNPPRGAA